MKRLIALILLLAFALCACGDKADTDDVGEFSFAAVREYYTAEMPGVRTEGFVNMGGSEPINAKKALKLARNELASEAFDDIRISHDSAEAVWEVYFGKLRAAGGCVSVYMDSYGRTILMVAGE